jgi:type VII secretion-associated serine protease mycosin
VRRFLTGTLAISMAAGVGALAAPGVSFAATPGKRLVTTVLDPSGRPIIRVQEVAAGLAGIAGDAEVDVRGHIAAAPTGTDPYRTDQWDVSKIHTTQAWQKSTGAGVIVAVIDTGVDGSHPDLAGHVLTGYNAITNKVGGNTDGNGHGTHVAGTIAALTGNGVGVSGFAPDARILPVKVFGNDGAGYMSDVAEGIVWATDHSAKVINMSIGSTAKLAAVSSAIKYARSKGVTVVAAAGNEREEGSPTSYPAADEGVIAVAATDSADRYAYYSNAGSYVDVAAPGSNIINTYSTSLHDGDYAMMSGTSMASPHVAAVAALLKAYQPAITPDQVEQALESSAVDLGTKGFDKNYGNGRIDAAAALAQVGRVVTANVTTRTVNFGTRTTTSFKVTSAGRTLAGAPVSVCLAVGAGAFTCNPVTTDANGAYSVSRIADGAFKARLFVPSTSEFAAASATATYTVKAVVTVVRAKPGVLSVKVTGASGQTMNIQRYTGGKWKTVKTFGTTATRTVTGLVKDSKYRVVVADTKIVTGVTSGTVKA